MPAAQPARQTTWSRVTARETSHRRILWATTVVGGATLGALLIGLARNKAVALIGGPEAVGLLGLFTAIVMTGASIATLGLDTSAVRQLSSKVDEPVEAAHVRWAIWTLALPLAIAGGGLIWLLRESIAQHALGNAAFSSFVGWLGIGVSATVIGASKMAVLQSYGRIGDVARVRLWGSLIATCISVGAIYKYGISGIVVAVIVLPTLNVALASYYARGLPSLRSQLPPRARLIADWRALVVVGIAVMAALALASFGQLVVRAIVTRQLGLDSAGFFQAANAIVSVNLTLILNAMAADYYPRLSQAAKDPGSVSLIMNQQLHVVLVLAAPVLAVVSVAAPLLLNILYSGEFSNSDFLLRLLVATGLLRLPTWTLSYLLLARGAGVSYLMGELAAALMLPVIWIFVNTWGLAGVGLGTVLAAILTFLTYLWRAKALGGQLSRENLGLSFALLIFLLALAFLFEVSTIAGILVGVAGAATLTWRSLGQLRSILAR